MDDTSSLCGTLRVFTGLLFSFYDPGWLRHFMTAPSPDSILLRSLRYSDLPFSHVNSWWTLLGQSAPFLSKDSFFLSSLLALPPPLSYTIPYLSFTLD